MIPSWTGIRALISSTKVPEMHVGVPPFILKPVTEYSTIYTSIINFVKVFNRPDPEARQLFCDEGFFRIVLDICLLKKDEFYTQLSMLNIAPESISKNLA